MSESDERLDSWLRKAVQREVERHASEEELEHFVVGQLAAERREEIGLHLERCEECLAAADLLRHLRGEIPPPQVLPEQVSSAWQRLRDRLENVEGPASDQAATSDLQHRPENKSRNPWWSLVAAALLVVALTAAFWSWRQEQAIETLQVELNHEREAASEANDRVLALGKELADTKEMLEDVRERWRTEAAPEVNPFTLNIPSEALRRGLTSVRAPDREVEAVVPQEARRFRVQLEDPSEDIHDRYVLLVRSANGTELELPSIERTRYGIFVVALSRGWFPNVDWIELRLIGIDDGRRKAVGRYVLHLR